MGKQLKDAKKGKVAKPLDLGITKKSFGLARKASTHKGRKILDNRAP